jgi:hypothetical protein
MEEKLMLSPVISLTVAVSIGLVAILAADCFAMLFVSLFQVKYDGRAA